MKNTVRKSVKGSTTSAPMVVKSNKKPALEMNAAPTHDEIARRSYEIFLEQGAVHGRDAEHWVQAEHELMHRARL